MRFLPRHRIGILAAYGAIAAAFCAPLFARLDAVGISDWDQHLFYYGSVLQSVVAYGQWPLWNPWYCGGNVLWQNPQVALLSPAFPFASAMSLALAMKLNIFVHFWMSFVGMHLLMTRIAGLKFLPVVMYLAAV